MNKKKSQIAMIWNVIIGVVFVFLAFGCFLFIQTQIEELKSDNFVVDAQNIDVTKSYAGVMSKINSKTLPEFRKYMIYCFDNETEFFGSKKSVDIYSTFQEDLVNSKEKEFKETHVDIIYDASSSMPIVSTSKKEIFTLGTSYFTYYVNKEFVLFNFLNINKNSDFPECKKTKYYYCKYIGVLN